MSIVATASELLFGLGRMARGANELLTMMRDATATPCPGFEPASRLAREKSLSSRLLGLAIASLTPGIFWSSVIAGVAAWSGSPLDMVTLVLTGAAITLFLAVVCAPLLLRGSYQTVENLAVEPSTALRFMRGPALGKDIA